MQQIYIFDTMLNQRVCLGIEKKNQVITFVKAFKTNVKEVQCRANKVSKSFERVACFIFNTYAPPRKVSFFPYFVFESLFFKK